MYLMQAASSDTGAIVTWVSETPDWEASAFPGPGDAEDVAIAAVSGSGGGGGSGFTTVRQFGDGGTYAVPDADVQVLVSTMDQDVKTIQLPATPSPGRRVRVKWVDGGPLNGNPVTIDGNGKSIDGSSTLVLPNDYGSVELFYDDESGFDFWSVISITPSAP